MNIKNNEYGDFYADYIELCKGAELQNLFLAGLNEARLLLKNLTEEEGLFRYEKGKWSVKEIFGHLIDTERIFCYRALSIARGDTNLPGYDHNQYVDQADFNSIPLSILKKQYVTNRNSTIEFFGAFTETEQLKKGTVNDNPFSVRAIGYAIAGHEIHHLNILAERYIPEFED